MAASQDKCTSIPRELKQRRSWVLYRLEARQDAPDGKPTKVPYSLGGTKASSTDALTWASFDDVQAAYARGGYDGIGYVFSSGDPYTGIDWDDCFHDDGSLKAWAAPHVKALEGTAYFERSQSGEGLHAIIRGKAHLWQGKHRISATEGVEVYSAERFFVVTGDVYGSPAATIGEAQAELNTLCQTCKPADSRTGDGQQREWSTGLSDPAVRDVVTKRYGDKFAALFYAGDLSAYNDDHSSADLALVGMLAYGCGPSQEQIDRLFRASKLFRAKWDSQRGGSTYGADTIAKVLATRDRSSYYGARPGAPQITILTPAELKAMPRADWLIEDVLVAGTVNVLYGAPGTYKSFQALDMAYSITTHRPWQGHRTRPGNALIVTPETIDTQQDRLAALEIVNSCEAPPGLAHIPHAVNLLQAAEVRAMCDAIEARGTGYNFIVFDTLAQAMVGGDENSAKDMGTAMGHLQELAKTMGATLLVIHHVTKATGKLRGAGGLSGAVATEIKAEAMDELVRLTATKVRHARSFAPMTLRARAVPIPNGLTPTSLVFDLTSEDMPQGGAGQGSRAEQALAILKGLSVEGCEVWNSDWQRACAERGIPKPTYDGAKEQLVTAGKVIKRMERNRAYYRPAPPTKLDSMWGDFDE